MGTNLMSSGELEQLWDLYGAGETAAAIARKLGRPAGTVNDRIRDAGGIRPVIARAAAIHLTTGEREEISRGLAAGESLRCIARRLGRAPSTVSREVSRHGGARRYRAGAADCAAMHNRRRPKPSRLATHTELRHVVEDKLALRWSPGQIAGWLRLEFPDDQEMWVSHETIYRSLFVQSKGALKRQLTAYLRTRRQVRKPGSHNRTRGTGKGQLTHTVHISQRPAEAEDRAVPGHWEGDLIMGKGQSAVVTLVERATRFAMLIALPEGHASDKVVAALAAQIATLPEQLRRSLTWDQGKEMAQHATFTVDTGVQIYFCDPKSPWQRGTNENTNRLLRQYFPKSTDLKAIVQAELDAVAAELNGRPRKTLGFLTPSQKFYEAVAATG
ncbi:MAG: IS30 family transposase [Actinomycetota bacterium]|nr:IS30 family transposase [Actinomycetota bacterium]